METKTLKIIQIITRVGKVLCKIAAICCIIGAAGCSVGIIALSAGGFDAFKIGGVTIHSMIEKSADTGTGTMYAAMATGLILCTGEFFIAKLSGKYFKNEIAAGTPFTLDGAKEMLRLGIYIIGISVVTLIIAEISCAVISRFFTGVADMHPGDFNQAGTGIAFIIISLLCRYGAEGEPEK